MLFLTRSHQASSHYCVAKLALVATFLGSCSVGAAIVASTDNDNTGASAVGSALTAARSTTSPATISFELGDHEGDPATVEISFDAGNGFRAITLAVGSVSLDGVPSNGPAPIEVLWDFATDLGGDSFTRDLLIRLNVVGGVSPAVLTGVSQGNDAPLISEAGSGLALPGSQVESSGNIDVSFLLRDSASDQVRISVEFQRVDDTGTGSKYRLARAAALPGNQPTPEYAFEEIATQPEAVQFEFRWDSTYAGTPSTGEADSQLGGKESDVRFRFTVEDLDPSGAPTGMISSAETELFRVDNNRPPFAVLASGSFALGVKDRGRIPIRFRVFDEESDEVGVVVQWRAVGNEFAALPSDLAALTDLLENPARSQDRRAAGIAKEAPHTFGGRLGALEGLPVDQVRLPELASSAAGLLAFGIEGTRLEILRSSRVPEPVAWASNPLSGPVASLVVEDGDAVLVLDSSSSGWQVRNIELDSGIVLDALAAGDGVPLAMAIDQQSGFLFVASSAAVFRFDLSGAPLGSVMHTHPGELRGLAALGSEVAIATVGDGLMRFDLKAESSETILTGLNEPWGIVRDPLAEGSVYVAERGANRIVSIDLDQGVPRAVPAMVSVADMARLGTVPFPSPRNLVLENRGARILVLCDRGSSTSLRNLDLRNVIDFDTAVGGAADPFVREITDQLNDADAGIAVGVDRLRVISSRVANQLAVGGGVQQRLRIATSSTDSIIPVYDPATQVALLATVPDPAVEPGDSWRIQAPPARGTPTGREFVFVWDSSDVPDAIQVQIRVLVHDNDLAEIESTSAFRDYSSSFAPALETIETGNEPHSLAAADIDGDGDIDLVTANRVGTVTIAFQTSPGVFDPGLTTLAAGTDSRAVAAADLDGDGDIDIVVANKGQGSNLPSLSLFFQTAPGVFTSDEILLPAGTNPLDVAVADLDEDGDMDLVTANAGLLMLFFQTSPGVFTQAASPLPAEWGAVSVVAADLDGDGDIDLATTSSDPSTGSVFRFGSLTVFFQTAPGVFVLSATQLPTDVNPVSIVAADLDGDGDIDLVSANDHHSSSNLTILFQTSPGVFTPGVAPLPTDLFPKDVIAADLDGDGDIDLASVTDFANDVKLFFQTTPGVFAVGAGSLPSGFIPTALVAADLDGDGDVDLATADGSFNSGTLRLFIQKSAGDFDAGENQVDVGGTLGVPVIVDIDGDGDLDLISPDSDNNEIIFSLQTSPGIFTPRVSAIATARMPASLAAADFDGDGDMDIVSANGFFGSSDLTLFFQTSSGSFVSEAGPSFPGSRPWSMAAADLDGDGDMDLVTANRSSDDLSLLFQTSPGVFEPSSTTLPAGDSPRDVVAVDLDGDGDMDLVSANELSHDLTLFFQTSAGVFTPAAAPLMTGFRPYNVAVADLDGDGDMDLVTANQFGSNLTLFFQESPGVYVSADAPLPTVGLPNSVVAVDLDGDGDIDLVSSNQLTNDLTIFFQTSPGEFMPAATPRPAGFAPFGVQAADLDGDGDLDLIIGHSSSDTLRILFNGN